MKLWVCIAVGLFAFSFSYWGNHGLGDSSRIPIGNWQTISNINWTEYARLENQTTQAGNEIETTLNDYGHDPSASLMNG